MTSRSIRPLDFAVLGVLAAGALHPYGIQKRLREWGKGEVVELGTRATFYKLIARLEVDGLVSAVSTTRDARYPERTTYAITPRGTAVAHEWLTSVLASPADEFPLLPAALSFAPMLDPEQLRDALERRRDELTQRRDAVRHRLSAMERSDMFPVTLLDDRFRERMLTAERDYVDDLIAEIDRGELAWDRERMIASIPPTPDAL